MSQNANTRSLHEKWEEYIFPPWKDYLKETQFEPGHSLSFKYSTEEKKDIGIQVVDGQTINKML